MGLFNLISYVLITVTVSMSFSRVVIIGTAFAPLTELDRVRISACSKLQNVPKFHRKRTALRKSGQCKGSCVVNRIFLVPKTGYLIQVGIGLSEPLIYIVLSHLTTIQLSLLKGFINGRVSSFWGAKGPFYN